MAKVTAPAEDQTAEEAASVSSGPNGFDPVRHLIKVQGGRNYLETKWRLVWLRDLHPDAVVETEIIDKSADAITMRAVVKIPYRNAAGDIDHFAVGTGTARESLTGGRFPAVETCETGALGRALATLGFGTQFSGAEFDNDGERLADSPMGSGNGARPRRSSVSVKRCTARSLARR